MKFLFAWRYFKAKKSTNAINVIAWVSIIAIVFVTASLVLVLSVFNGFEGLVKSLYSNFYTDLKVSPAIGKIMTVSPHQLDQLKKLDGIKLYSLVVEEKAMIQNGENQPVVYVKGVDENYQYVSGVSGNILDDAGYDIGTRDIPKLIVGIGVEDALDIRADKNIYLLKIYLPKRSDNVQINELEDFSNDTIRSSAAFKIQQEFDNKYAITNIDFIRKAMKLGPDEYSSVEIALKDPGAAGELKKAVRKIFGDGYLVQNKYEQNRSLFSVMNMERWAIYAVLSLILVVAAFTMIGALTMLVLEKQKDMHVLHALGGSRGFIRGIFFSEGLLIAIIGSIIGMILAIIIALIQQKYHVVPMGGGSFLIDYFPVKLRLMDFLLVGITVLLIAMIASWIPARKAVVKEFSLRSD